VERNAAAGLHTDQRGLHVRSEGNQLLLGVHREFIAEGGCRLCLAGRPETGLDTLHHLVTKTAALLADLLS
jgi:hypothetical protein